MVTKSKAAFDFSQFILDVVGSIGAKWTDAWQTFLDRTKAAFGRILSMRPDLWVVYWNLELFGATEELLSACVAATSASVLEAAIAQFPLPSSYGWTVVRKDQCIKDVLHLLAVDSQEITQPNGLYSAIFLDYLVNRIGGLRLLFRQPLEWILKKVVGRVVQLIVTILTLSYTAFSTIIILGLLVVFAKLVLADKFPTTLQQKTPRKKVYTTDGGIIRRRAVGGNPP